jgi:hypothetical protein
MKGKTEALQKARAKKTTHILEPFIEENADEDDDQAVDRELERVQPKVQQLQKEKERFANHNWKQKKGFGKTRET